MKALIIALIIVALVAFPTLSMGQSGRSTTRGPSVSMRGVTTRVTPPSDTRRANTNRPRTPRGIPKGLPPGHLPPAIRTQIPGNLAGQRFLHDPREGTTVKPGSPDVPSGTPIVHRNSRDPRSGIFTIANAADQLLIVHVSRDGNNWKAFDVDVDDERQFNCRLYNQAKIATDADGHRMERSYDMECNACYSLDLDSDGNCYDIYEVICHSE